MSAPVLTNTDPALRRAVAPVARSADVGRIRWAVRLLGEDWALVRLHAAPGATRLAAFLDRCPHRLAPLSAGRIDDDVLRLRLSRLVLR